MNQDVIFSQSINRQLQPDCINLTINFWCLISIILHSRKFVSHAGMLDGFQIVKFKAEDVTPVNKKQLQMMHIYI